MFSWSTWQLVVLLQLTTSQVCDDARECYNSDTYCDDIHCNLKCNSTQSCANLNYKCNSTEPSSTCTIDCNGYEACKNINIYSSATTNELNCVNWPSCIDANINCNSSNTTHSSCVIHCASARSCDSLSFYCSSSVSSCILNCENEPDSCSNIHYDCEATTLCEYNCPNQDISSNDYYCPNLECQQCSTSSTTTSSSSTTTSTTTAASTTVIIAETQTLTNYIIQKHIEIIDPKKLSSAGYHIVFGFFFLFAFIYILYCIITNLTFFQQMETMDAIFSLLPVMLFLSGYETLSCWIMGGTATYLSDRELSAGAYYWSILIPLQFIIIISHIVIWYLYLIYYGKNSSLNYIYMIALRLSPKYPRSLYFIPMIVLFAWSFIVMIIAYSVASGDTQSATAFVSFIVILECVCGICIAMKLIAIALTYVQMQYVLNPHEETTMKLLFVTSICVLFVYLAIFIMALAIWDYGNFQFQSYVADVMRVFQLLFELFFILLSGLLFFYIPPSPELHKTHRQSFHAVYHANMAYLDEDEEDEAGFCGFDDVDQVLIPHTPVFVYNKEEWILARVQKLGSNNTVCFVTKEDEYYDTEQKQAEAGANGSNNIIIVQLHRNTDKQYIKLALFDVYPAMLETDYDHKYAVQDVPVVLMTIRDKLFELEGHTEVGIFRKESSETEYGAYKLAVEQQRMESYDYDEFDVHILANLIKDFYRSLPSGCKVLQCFDFIHEDINNAVMLLRDMKMLLNDKNPNYTFEDKMSKTLVVWLWSLCADIIQFASENKMSIDTFAIVVAPNLYDHCVSDPRQYMQIQHRLQKFCALGIEYMLHKQQQRQRKSMSSMTSIKSVTT